MDPSVTEIPGGNSDEGTSDTILYEQAYPEERGFWKIVRNFPPS